MGRAYEGVLPRWPSPEDEGEARLQESLKRLDEFLTPELLRDRPKVAQELSEAEVIEIRERILDVVGRTPEQIQEYLDSIELPDVVDGDWPVPISKLKLDVKDGDFPQLH